MRSGLSIISLSLIVVVSMSTPLFGQVSKGGETGKAKAAAKAAPAAKAASTTANVPSPAPHPNGKKGGVLNITQRGDLAQGFSIHETATVDTVWPAAPCFNNLVLFDPYRPVESPDAVIPELAEKWSWQDNYRNLVLFLRKNVKWHDGQPFTAKDVKYTFDMVREAKEATAKLRLNPRKDWYANVDNIEVADTHTVIFHLKRPQPSLVMMLASGYSPVMPAHVPPADYRGKCIGTGPYKLKEWKRGELIEYVRNPDYWVKDRPYLDGLRYVVIVERGTQYAALQAGRVDVPFPGQTTKPIADQLKASGAKLVFHQVASAVNDNIIMNIKKPPFDNVKVRRAVSYAIDRQAWVKALYQGGAAPGAAMVPKPYGVWGLDARDLASLPGQGKGADDKARAKKLLSEAGVTLPIRTEIATRANPLYVDFASFVVNELKQVGIEATVKQIETAQWHATATRGEYQIGANLTGLGADDPDVNLFENYACGSPRNYTFYCDEQVMKQFEQQSQELDPKKRMALLGQIQKKLEEDAARPIMGWTIDYFPLWPHVKNLVPHNNIYNYGRLQEVWLDK